MNYGEVTGIIPFMLPVNERRRYMAMPSLIGWAHAQNDPWVTKPHVKLATGQLPLIWVIPLSVWRRIVNLLALGMCENNFKGIIFRLILRIDIWSTFLSSSLRGMPQYVTNEKWTLIQVMAKYRQATSHYMSQCWVSSLSPYGVIRSQCINSFGLSDAYMRQ